LITLIKGLELSGSGKARRPFFKINCRRESPPKKLGKRKGSKRLVLIAVRPGGKRRGGKRGRKKSPIKKGTGSFSSNICRIKKKDLWAHIYSEKGRPASRG